MSSAGRALLTALEGYELKAYRDSAGLWTIGVGHLLTQNELDSNRLVIAGRVVDWRDGLTTADVDTLLQQDLAQTEAAVGRLVTVDISQPQFDALASFCFNVGETAFAQSGLLLAVNTLHWDDVPNEWRRWKFATVDGKKIIIKGLVDRREKELKRWATGVPVKKEIPDDEVTPPTPVDSINQRSPELPTPRTPRDWLRNLNPLDILPGWGTYITMGAAVALFVIDTYGYHINPIIYGLLVWFAGARLRRAVDRSARQPSTHYYGDDYP